MGEIKSALELALERTADIKSDKTSIEIKEIKDKGKRSTSQFLNSEINSDEFKNLIKKEDKNKIKWFKEGCFDVLTANLTLPADEGFTAQLEKLQEGICIIVKDEKPIKQMFSQISQFFTQYLENRNNIEEQLTAQYEPMLRKKEHELSQQMGTEVHLSPMQDPEFMKQLQQHIGQLERQYNDVLLQAKTQMKDLLG